MQIKHEKPPIWENACAAFRIDPKYTIFTYGDTIYNPGNIKVSDDLIAHEKVHMIQQGEQPDLWWGEYLREPTFRAEQEAQAYAAQFAFILNKNHDRNSRILLLTKLARLLSGPLYAGCISYRDALELIQDLSHIHILK